MVRRGRGPARPERPEGAAAARPGRRRLRARGRPGRELELRRGELPRLRVHPPDLHQAVHPVPRLPDAGRLPRLPLALAGPPLLPALRRAFRPARPPGPGHRGGPGRAPVEGGSRWDVTDGPAPAAPSGPCATRGSWWPTATTGGRRCRTTRGWRTSAARCCTPRATRARPSCGASGSWWSAPATPGATSRSRAPRTPSATLHSTRRGYYYNPKYAMGRPSDQTADLLLALRLPLPLRRAIFKATLRLTTATSPGSGCRSRTTSSSRRTRSSTSSSSTTSGTATSCPSRTWSGSRPTGWCSPTGPRRRSTWCCSAPATWRRSPSWTRGRSASTATTRAWPGRSSPPPTTTSWCRA